MISITQLVIWVMVVLPGLAIWFGEWRSWTRVRLGLGYLPLAIPWFAVGISVADLCYLVAPAFPAIPLQQSGQVGLTVFLVFGLLCGLTTLPRWATPQWFRDEAQEDERQSRQARQSHHRTE